MQFYLFPDVFSDYETFFSNDEVLKISVRLPMNIVYDCFCFGTSVGEILEPSCSVYRGKKSASNNAIKLEENSSESIFWIILSKIPRDIRRLIFVLNVFVHPMNIFDFPGLGAFDVDIVPLADEEMSGCYSDYDFLRHPTISFLEITRREDLNDWKIRMRVKTFNGLMQGDKNFVGLSLKKKSLSEKTRAVMLLDGSALMKRCYLDGSLFQLMRKISPELLSFDQNWQMDFYIFGSQVVCMPQINISNAFMILPPRDWQDILAPIENNNDLYLAMETVIDRYKSSSVPVNVFVLTNGDVEDRKWIKQLVIESESYLIFWNFLALHGKTLLTRLLGLSDYVFLKKLSRFEHVNVVELDKFQQTSLASIRYKLRNKFSYWIKILENEGFA